MRLSAWFLRINISYLLIIIFTISSGVLSVAGIIESAEDLVIQIKLNDKTKRCINNFCCNITRKIHTNR